MSKFIGRKTYIGIGKESERGNSVFPTFWIPTLEVNFEDKFEVEKYGEKFGSIFGNGNFGKSINKKGSGSFTIEVDADYFGLILLATFGYTTTSGPIDSAYTHTYSILESNIHQSLTILEYDPIKSYQYPLAVVERLEINVESNSIITCIVNFSSKLSDVVI